MLPSSRYFLLLLLFPLLHGCSGSGQVRAFKDSNEINALNAEEKRLWHESKNLDKKLSLSNQIYDDPATTVYLQTIMDKLFPEFEGRIRVKIVKTPHLNAFALPNGSIYVHLGLMARFENEAQLATVLAHEGAHFIDKHGLRSRRNLKDSSAFAVGTALVGIPFIGHIAALSSVYGYSQDLENDADRIGYQRLIKAGYDPSETVQTFQHLAAEVKAQDLEEPYFFSTHPKLQERIDNFTELNKSSKKGGYIGKQDYLTATSDARIDSLQADLSLHRYKSIILALSTEHRQALYPGEAFYFLGEAYRLRGNEGDKDKAIEAYNIALNKAPEFPLTHRALGLHHMKNKQYEKAKSYFDNYIRLAPTAKDIAFIREYSDSLTQEAF